jgi:hypothetical protein
MSATQGTTGYGATLWIGATISSPQTFVQVLEIKSIKMPDRALGTVDATTLQSPGAIQEKLPTTIAPGTLEITGNYIADATQQIFDTAQYGRTLIAWKTTAPVAGGTKVSTHSGVGYVAKVGKGPYEIDKPIDITVSIEVTGVVTEVVA